jgi:CBS domain-containing protein
MEVRTWRCDEVMTRNPICCVADDRVRDVAKLMEEKDLGPIPVVDGHRSRRLCGIVTDRDLTLKVLAEGRDPKSTRVKDEQPGELQGGGQHRGLPGPDGEASGPAHSNRG